MADQLEPDTKRRRISSDLSEKALKTLTDSAECAKAVSFEFSSNACEEELPVKAVGSDCKLHPSSANNAHLGDTTKERIIEIDIDPNQVPSGEANPCKSAGVSEKEVGILEFVSDLPGFHGVLKQRYTDFIVSERDLEGNLVRLTNLTVPKDEKTTQLSLDILTPEDMETLQRVIDDKEKKLSVRLSADDDKDHRRLVHRAIKANYQFLGTTLSLLCLHVV